VPCAFAGFDFTFQPSLDRGRIMALAELKFIDRSEAVHFVGPPGTGKSHLGAALGAERQARYRARRAVQQPHAAVRRRTVTDRRSRSQRWRDAIAERLALQAEYAAWSDALPESLRDTATAEALQEIIDLDLNSLADVNPPRGFGRDSFRMKWGISARRFWGISRRH
jgi:hypothetical protein